MSESQKEEMILCVDVGNTTTACGIFRRDGLLLRTFRFRTRTDLTPEELLLFIRGFLDLLEIPVRAVKGVAYASVVPPLDSVWEAVVRRWLVKEWLVVSAESIPITVKLRYPSEVGADRLVNAYAAWVRWKQAVIVVDFGTATTFDCVSPEGEYLGGAIAPGLETAAEFLFRRAAKLPRVDLSRPPEEILGRDTVSAMKSGLLYGFVGLTEGLVERLSREMATSPMVVATGGLSRIIAPLCRVIREVVPELTLEGLYLLYRERVKGV
ncbi:type III pantothenate kinase [Thermosulfurimonas sp. F29]|uniref:type III pantothenate kinase n=1 Tax=Thermosulfurimonas sp. F29 TaxID=2867247 RepID=UPI00210463E6|nr:type III pantothenate kinase [Thermosulfurimonas sp. F29]